ncbi:MAG: DUF134 domain-containing protein [Deltaproteobacteria bacterium]|nr:DUF134 domain-containing protein [Deltaproteobacteria bacterium]
MPRPFCRRRIQGFPAAPVFKPAGVPLRDLEEVVLALDEYEAIRLADLNGLYQEQASEEMGVSRTTFSRIVDAAHRKIADAIVHGKAIRIEGGPVIEEGPVTGTDRRPRCCERHAKQKG